MKRLPVQMFRPMDTFGCGNLTLFLITICVVEFIACFIPGSPMRQQLELSHVDFTNAADLTVWRAFLERVHGWREILPEIRRGELWRLITPLFLHLSFLHLFFNMLFLRDLGTMVEERQGKWTLLALVLALGMASNLAQYLVTGGGFGGMSGVVYGLLGYIWIRGRLDPKTDLHLHAWTVAVMFIWFLGCLVLLWGLANTAHALGLVLGVVWGLVTGLRGWLGGNAMAQSKTP